MHICVFQACANSPRLHVALQRLQAGLDQVERLEQQSGAGPTERSTHEGFDSWVSLSGNTGKTFQQHFYKLSGLIWSL